MTDTSTVNTHWEKLPAWFRKPLSWSLWFVTWTGLMAGQFNNLYFQYVVAFSIVHSLLVIALLDFRITAFPAQVRLAYLLWVVIGTFVPGMGFLMLITTIGVAANLSFGYCLLARLLTLLPWNRDEPFSLALLRRVFLSGPVNGRFRPPLADLDNCQDSGHLGCI